MERVPMTTYGLKKMEQELKHLQDVERPAIIEAIEEARAHGDLKENAEYHAAKEKQGFIEGRIAELKDKTSRAQVIDPTTINSDKIVLGATVKVVDCDSDKEMTYVLVGPDEADIDKGLLSTTSPIGRSLLGKSVGDEIVVRAPGGEREYEITDISFIEITA